jgi:hypothetical protein
VKLVAVADVVREGENEGAAVGFDLTLPRVHRILGESRATRVDCKPWRYLI